MSKTSCNSELLHQEFRETRVAGFTEPRDHCIIFKSYLAAFSGQSQYIQDLFVINFCYWLYDIALKVSFYKLSAVLPAPHAGVIHRTLFQKRCDQADADRQDKTDNACLFCTANEKTRRSSKSADHGSVIICLLSCNSSDTQRTDATLEN